MAQVFDPAEAPGAVLVVTAHPDDVDFGAAGTVATLSAAGVKVTYGIVTNGDAGEADGVHRDDVAALRQTEQTAAAAVVGVHDVRFLGYPDGRVEPTLELRRDISRLIRETRPDIVICQFPERAWDRIFASHPDHLAAGEATIRAVYPDARNPWAHPELGDEGLEAHTVTEVWMMAAKDADLYVDITDVFDRKVAALRAHASQTGSRDDLEDLLRDWATANAQAADLPPGTLAEAFRILRIPG